MGCSVKTGSAGSAEKLRKITKATSIPYGENTFTFSELFPNITPKYVGLEEVVASVLSSSGDVTQAIYIDDDKVRTSAKGGGQSMTVTFFALY